MYCLIFFSNCFSSPIASNLTNTASIFETILTIVGPFCQLCKITQILHMKLVLRDSIWRTGFITILQIVVIEANLADGSVGTLYG